MSIKQFEMEAEKEVESIGSLESIIAAVDMIARERVSCFASYTLGHSMPCDPKLGVDYGMTLLRTALKKAGIEE